MKIAYLTDVEGQWAKLESFVAGNPMLGLGADGRLLVAAGARFVFGGDAIDRGPAGRRIVHALLEVKRRQPEQVVLLAGNRDINKMRLATELTSQPPKGAPVQVLNGPKAALLRWIFDNTMGARDAFAHRSAELASDGSAHDDDAVVASFLEDVAPGGELTAYLSACQLAYREADTLFVHGGVTAESLGCVPEAPGPVANVDDWVAELNTFYARQCAAFRAGEPSGYATLIAYQAPVPGTRLNQASVVYGRPTDDLGNPHLPHASVVAALARAGVTRVVLGHTPSGDCPAVLRDGAGFELVLADNSYGRLELGSQLLLDEDPRFVGRSVLDGGETVAILTLLAREGASSPLGLRDASGRLLKARLQRGDYLAFRGLPGYQSEQRALAQGAVSAPLAPPV